MKLGDLNFRINCTLLCFILQFVSYKEKTNEHFMLMKIS